MLDQLQAVRYAGAHWKPPDRLHRNSSSWVFNRNWEVWENERQADCFSQAWRGGQALRPLSDFPLYQSVIFQRIQVILEINFQRMDIPRLLWTYEQLLSRNIQTLKWLLSNLPIIWVILDMARTGIMLHHAVFSQNPSKLRAWNSSLASMENKFLVTGLPESFQKLSYIFNLNRLFSREGCGVMLEGKNSNM